MSGAKDTKDKPQVPALDELAVGFTCMFFLQLEKLKLVADVNSARGLPLLLTFRKCTNILVTESFL